MGKHHPDHELQLMQRVLRDLAKLTPAGRERVVAYWQHRVASMTDAPPAAHGEQQLDLEVDALRTRIEGGVGAPLHAASTDTHAHPHTPSEIFGTNETTYIHHDIQSGVGDAQSRLNAHPADMYGRSGVLPYTRSDIQ